MKRYYVLFLFFLIVSCKENQTEKPIPVEPDGGIGDGAGPPPALTFSENMEEAHNKVAFMTQRAISFDIELQFGGQSRLDGKISMTTTSSRVRLDKPDGTTIVYNGENVFISPDTTSTEGARFDIFTWQYFFALPFKLTDPGTVWGEKKTLPLDSMKYETSQLSFKEDIGDSPDDWYIIYKDPETSRLKAAAYIVTFNREKQEAEKNPHAIVYTDYKMVENVAIATKWSFHNWNNEIGLGEKLGEAEIKNIQFFDPDESYFTKPENSRIIER